MITDSLGDELTYWPVSLVEGEASDPIVVTVPIPASEAYLTGTDDPAITVYGRKVGDTTWINIQDDPIPLLPYYPTSGGVDFEVYVEGTGAVVGLERIPITVTAGSGGPAGWSS